MAEGNNENGTLFHNLLLFGRLLRSMGLKISVDQMSDLAHSLALIDISNRSDFYYTARGLLVTNPHDFDRFDQAFGLFWTGMQSWLLGLGQARHLRQASGEEEPLDAPDPILAPGRDDRSPFNGAEEAEQDSQDRSETAALYSPLELLRHKNFAAFSEEEKRIVRQAMAKLVWEFNARQTRRLRRTGKRTHYLDLRRSIRANTRNGGEIIHLAWRRRKLKPRPLVVI
jgi:uncharacterized protein with von Willebrand factor type A (vWA) domain